ncbi:MAG TPA: GTP-binding protein, partial [Chromatiales bacterium]|nr:GTP-binding protein [Chromatiales bacterium]
AHLQYIRDNISQIQATAQQGRLQQEGMTVVIAGSPNVGKSSLMNALAERETAIVTDVPGTTRDVLRERIQIDGLPLHLIDTAGLHETADAVEKEGIRRAREAMADADHTLLLVDDSADFALEGQGTPDLAAELAGNPNVTRVYNKIDLSGRESGLGEHQGKTHIGISARSGAGIDALRGYLKTCVGYRAGTEGVFMARRRHLQALDDASACLQRADKALTATTPELLADDLRQAQIALGRITGDVSSDDLLGEIFSSFCIGK